MSMPAAAKRSLFCFQLLLQRIAAPLQKASTALDTCDVHRKMQMWPTISRHVCRLRRGLAVPLIAACFLCLTVWEALLCAGQGG